MKTIMTYIFGLALTVAPAISFAGTAEDFDAEVEDSMAETDATAAHAQLQREREDREAREAERLREEGKRSKAAADERRRQVTKELIGLEHDILAHLNEQAAHKKSIARDQKSIAEHEVRLKKSQDRLAKLKAENEALQKVRDDQASKIAQLNVKITDTAAETKKVAMTLEEGKKGFAKGQAEHKEAIAKLKSAEREQAATKVRTVAQLQRLREMNRLYKEKTERLNAETKTRQQAMKRMEGSVRSAQAEVDKSAAEADAVAAKSQSATSRAPASAPAVQTSFKLKKDCRVFDAPNGKVLGTKKVGGSFIGKADASWISFVAKDKRTVFIPKSCAE